MVKILSFNVGGKGFYEIIGEVQKVVDVFGIDEGLCIVMIQYMLVSLMIQENVDFLVWCDFGNWFDWLVRENDFFFIYIIEGLDDMLVYIKVVLMLMMLLILIFEG